MLKIKANWVFIFPQNPWEVIPPVGPITSPRGDVEEFKVRLSLHQRLRARSSSPLRPLPGRWTVHLEHEDFTNRGINPKRQWVWPGERHSALHLGGVGWTQTPGRPTWVKTTNCPNSLLCHAENVKIYVLSRWSGNFRGSCYLWILFLWSPFLILALLGWM